MFFSLSNCMPYQRAEMFRINIKQEGTGIISLKHLFLSSLQPINDTSKYALITILYLKILLDGDFF